jgi:DNA repair protein RecN (Recombination protein N)
MRIQGLGVIAEADVELGAGLTVLTGETGAGKTMVVTGLHLLSGARADPSRVRTDARRAVVEGRFTLDGPAGAAAAAVVEAAGADADEDGTVIAVRTVSADGPSRAHLGGRSVPAGTLAEFTGPLLTVHGQNDQLRLLRPAEQRAALDRSAEQVAPLLAAYRDARARWQTAARDLAERTARSAELAREAESLRAGLEEVAAVDPQPGEDVELSRTVNRLGDLDALRSGAAQAQAALMGSDDDESGGALGLVAQARARMLAAGDDALTAQQERLGEVVAVLTDVGAELSAYLADLPADGAALDSVLTRQSELKTLVRQHATDVDGVLEWAQHARARLVEVDVSGDTLDALAQRRDALAENAAAAAGALRAARQAAATVLAAAVSTELSGLAMGQAQLEVAVTDRPAADGDTAALLVDGVLLHAGAHGVDEVELRLVAHAGAPALPVGRSASGGELSRVMLALEVVLATADTTATLVFDEVDAGVGGRAAVEVGRRLARLARTHQVIVVTHLPQVAAFADTHLVVDKAAADGAVTASGVRRLTSEERVAELARMLAGLDDTDTGRAHAEELLQTASADRAR